MNFRLAFTHIKNLPLAFWGVILASFINQTGNMAFVFLIIYLIKSLHFSATSASAAFVCFSLSNIAAGMVGGNLSDKIGAARVMILVLISNSLVLMLFPFAKTVPHIMILCVLWGSIYGLYKPASQTLISYLSPPGFNKITFSLYRLVLNLGMSIGPAIGGYIAAVSFSSIFTLNGLANLCAGSVLFLALRRSHWIRYKPAANARFDLGIKSLLQNKQLKMFALAMVLVCMVFFQHESTLPVFLDENLHLPLNFYGLLFTINTLLIVLLELPLNIATLRWSYRTNFMLGSLLIAIGFAGFYFATNSTHIIALTVIWTFGEMILFPAANSYIADIAPLKERGSYMSILSTCSNVALLFGPYLGAYVLQYEGALNLWIMCGLWGMLSVVLFSYESAVARNEMHQETA